jgi:2-C-methyl-D-erythritol 2,4-cyclodiphosphate synthase
VYRVGLGCDIHKFKEKRKLMLGGVEIKHTRGLDGHSDADVVLHALGDALLGAAALGDLGQHFPGNEINKDRASHEILREICVMVASKGFKIINADVVVMAEEPKLSPYRDEMVLKISEILNVEKNFVGIKATTCEGLGFVGRQEGIMAQAVVMLEKRQV